MVDTIQVVGLIEGLRGLMQDILVPEFKGVQQEVHKLGQGLGKMGEDITELKTVAARAEGKVDTLLRIVESSRAK